MADKEIKRKKKEIEEQEKQEQKDTYLALVKEQESMLQERMMNLPEFLKTKNSKLALDLRERIIKNDDDKLVGLSTPTIMNILSQGMSYAGVTPKYTAQSLYFAFESFKEAVDIINRSLPFVPTKQSLAAYMGISVTTLNLYKKSNDPDMREQAEMIEDYLVESSLTSAQFGQLKESSTMFRLKAEKAGFGIKEAQSNIQVEVKKSNTLSKSEMIKKLISTGAIIDVEDYKEEK